jgi:hypothetical protein
MCRRALSCNDNFEKSGNCRNVTNMTLSELSFPPRIQPWRINVVKVNKLNGVPFVSTTSEISALVTVFPCMSCKSHGMSPLILTKTLRPCRHCGGKHMDFKCWELPSNANKRPQNWKSRKGVEAANIAHDGRAVDFHHFEHLSYVHPCCSAVRIDL